jgi:putative NADH-flavin reductase
MRLFLLGASGRTGRLVLAEALARGHGVTAFVRRPAAIGNRDAHVTIRVGDPCNAAQLRSELTGHDAVISTLGVRRLREHRLLPTCAGSLIEAMDRTGVRRVVATSSWLLFSDVGRVGAIVRWLIRQPLHGTEEMEALFAASGLVWTIVRAAKLTNGPFTGQYRIREVQPLPHPRPVARADVASFLLDEVERGGHARGIVGVCR